METLRFPFTYMVFNCKHFYICIREIWRNHNMKMETQNEKISYKDILRQKEYMKLSVQT